jgi:hypothetical protein
MVVHLAPKVDLPVQAAQMFAAVELKGVGPSHDSGTFLLFD